MTVSHLLDWRSTAWRYGWQAYERTEERLEVEADSWRHPVAHRAFNAHRAGWDAAEAHYGKDST